MLKGFAHIIPMFVLCTMVTNDSDGCATVISTGKTPVISTVVFIASTIRAKA
jgi:hypothetical protein